MNLVLFFGTSILSLASQAMFGYNANENALDSACRIMTYTPDKSVYTCSGVLISKDEVVTARHCFEHAQDGDVKYSVSCGFIPGLRKKSNAPKSPSALPKYSDFLFQEPDLRIQSILVAGWVKDDTGKIFADDSDFAVIKLAQPSRMPPIPLLAENYFPDHGLETLSNCRVAGFGVAETGFIGALHTSPLSTGFFNLDSAPDFIEYRKDFSIALENEDFDSSALKSLVGQRNVPSDQLEHTFVEFHKKNLVPVTTIFGDSGGPLICHVKGQKSPRVLGSLYGVSLESVQACRMNSKTLVHFTSTMEWSLNSFQSLIPLESFLKHNGFKRADEQNQVSDDGKPADPNEASPLATELANCPFN